MPILLYCLVLRCDSVDSMYQHTVYKFTGELMIKIFSSRRFISERGSSRLLDHVEQIDKLHKIPPPTGSIAKPERTNDIMPLPAVPKLRYLHTQHN